MATYGINEQGITKITTAMSNYRQEVYTRNSISAANAKLTAALKGTNIEKEVKSLASSVESAIDSLMKDIMTDFSSRISNVATSYKKQDSSSTAVKNVINSLKS